MAIQGSKPLNFPGSLHQINRRVGRFKDDGGSRSWMPAGVGAESACRRDAEEGAAPSGGWAAAAGALGLPPSGARAGVGRGGVG